MKKVVIGNCTLYLADAMEMLPELIAQGDRADVLVCDPPYKLSSGGDTEGGLQERIGKSNERYNNDGNMFSSPIPEWKDFMPLFYHILRNRAHAYVMADGRNQLEMQIQARNSGFYHHNLLRWGKKAASPNRWYMKNDEFIGFYSKGKAFRINDCGSFAGIDMSHTDETNHPTEKPVALMEYYIRNSSKEGDLVIDPFMGVASTGVACVRSGRKFIGIEIDEQWFDVACERIERETLEYQHILI